jgi:hypothetical protein
MLKLTLIIFNLINILSCGIENQEEINSSNLIELDQIVNVKFHEYPFDWYDESINQTIKIPIALEINGECEGITPGSVYINDESLISDQGSNDFISIDASTYRIQNNSDVFITNQNENLFTGKGININEAYSYIDCQKQKNFKLLLYDQEIIQDVITSNCSHQIPFSFHIRGQNKNNTQIQIKNSIVLTEQQCKRNYACHESFRDRPFSYMSLPFLNSSEEVYFDTFKAVNSSSSHGSKNNPYLICTSDQLFNIESKIEPNYNTRISNQSSFSVNKSDNNRTEDIFILSNLIHDTDSLERNSIGSTSTPKIAIAPYLNGFNHTIQTKIKNTIKVGEIKVSQDLFNGTSTVTKDISLSHAALFYMLYNLDGTKIKNITLESSSFENSHSSTIKAFSTFSYLAGAIYSDNSSSGMIDFENIIFQNNTIIENNSIASFFDFYFSNIITTGHSVSSLRRTELSPLELNSMPFNPISSIELYSSSATSFYIANPESNDIYYDQEQVLNINNKIDCSSISAVTCGAYPRDSGHIGFDLQTIIDANP